MGTIRWVISSFRRFGSGSDWGSAARSGRGFKGDGLCFSPLFRFDLLVGVLCIPEGGVVTMGSANPR